MRLRTDAFRASVGNGVSSRAGSPVLLVGASLLVAAVAWGFSAQIGRQFVDEQGRPMPPAYHDEYSYLFQAETFLAGRTWFPSFEPRPELFDQMHVLNEGRFASRYFPGTGAWLTPFVAWADPWLGQRVAHVLCAVLMLWIGSDLRGVVCGLTAGLLFALSPGLAVFSTLLLAHHPTLLGLLLFTWAFLRMRRTHWWWWAVLAGTGLSFAMLCRPMTAAGFGLPFGLWFAWFLSTGRSRPSEGTSVPDVSLLPAHPHSHSRHVTPEEGQTKPREEGLSPAKDRVPFSRRVGLAFALVAPLIAGIGVMLWYSSTITDEPLVTPYQLYTDVYTPRHVYGFDNVVRGEQRLGPKVIDNYDQWAENLTPALAVKNVGKRFITTLRLTLGIVPLTFALLFLVLSRRLTGDGWLLLAAIISLQAVHIPYWFSGIMDWHYVLESAPCWLLLCGMATAELFRAGPVAASRLIRGWWLAILGTAVLVNSVTVPLPSDPEQPWLLWRGRAPQRVAELRFARSAYADVRNRIDELRRGAPAVLLVIPVP
ncbi:MAG: hypothetical protein KDA75_21770, partial [Planctomycetaceae bacterium]|nr:hypothetical protein [Planctomycetaceae bacterium]